MGKTVVAVVGIVAAVAIAVVAPYLAPLALGALGITATATAIAVATAVISIGLSLAVSFAFRALGVGAPSAKNAVGPPSVFRQAISNSFIVYGMRRVGGLLVFYHAKESGDDHYRYYVIAVAGHHCSHVNLWMLNDEVVDVGGTGLVSSGPYAGNAWLFFQNGSASETANSTFVADCDGKWTTAHKGSGIAAIYAKFKLTDDVVQAGMPNITAVISGKDDILDTRTATTGYTATAALVFYDWLKLAREEGGFGAYDDEIPSDAWISAQANVCEEHPTGEGSNARYQLNGVITTGAAPSEIRDVMVVNCAGSYTYSGGKHLMRVGYYVPPTATLSEDDLAGPIQVTPFSTADVAANEVSGTYISPDNNYQASPFKTQTVAGSPTDIRQLDLDLAFVIYKPQADRVARIMLNRAQAEKQVIWTMNIEGLKHRALDTLQLASTRYGLDNYAWAVTNWQLSADYGAVLSLREENADIYDDPTPVSAVTPPTISQPGAFLTQAEKIDIINKSGVSGLSFSIAANGDITISTHTRVYSDKSVSVTGATVTHASGAVAGDIEEVYYDDSSRAGGVVTYQVLRLPGGVGNDSSAIASPSYPSRHNVLAARVPASGSTSGGSDVGSGGGTYTGSWGGSGRGIIP